MLRTFLLDPSRAYYQRQIEQASGLQLRAVQRELERLTASGLLYRRMEGNRAYYQVDTDYPLLYELRALILKAADDLESLRGRAAQCPGVRLCFLAGDETRVLAVGVGAEAPAFDVPARFTLETMSGEAFLELLRSRSPQLDPFLKDGQDLLGRREDVIWRRIEEAGWSVRKGAGVP